uniref:F-box domain-containing protein n=1 Tax=Meloidogyne hapla TaxID=6305 RepID=A0A1I8BSH5_MELHA
MPRTLFDICLSAVCQRSVCYDEADLALLPCDCKQRLLEYFVSHDLTKICLYLSDQLDDSTLGILAEHCNNLRYISLIECSKITDIGIINLTQNQTKLKRLELVGLSKITSAAFSFLKSKRLSSVDLSGCSKISSEGIFNLVYNNPSIISLCLNGCSGLDEQALYDIAHCIGERLCRLELDNLHNSNIIERVQAIHSLSQREEATEQCLIEGSGLKDIDLYGNYFWQPPTLPLTLCSLRLSVTGQENVQELITSLQQQTKLVSIHLQLQCFEEDAHSIEKANTFLYKFLRIMGAKVTRLHIAVQRLCDSAMLLIASQLPNLSHLALDVYYLNSNMLRRLFAGGFHSQGAKLRSLRLCRLKITYRALFSIGRWARSLVDLETSHMSSSVDDRFLVLLAKNCKLLQTVNFNGCKWVTDKGLAGLARNKCLREVRIRGTSCTDKSLYSLAQFCPALEWIAHADFSGRPKFSDQALKCLRDACIQRVIC